MRFPNVLLLSLLACAPAFAADLRCTGHVFLDQDADGRRDRGEPGIADVGVSDGERILRTDAAGRYDFRVRDGRSVFLVKPAGYLAPSRPDGLPDTWRNLQRKPGPSLRYGGVPARKRPACGDFALRRGATRANAALEVHVSGDPQVKTPRDVDFYLRDIVEPLAGGPRADLAITLGDIVNDDLSLFPAIKAVDARLGTPWLHAPGNHDIDFDADDANSLSTFRHAFGPDTYAWEEPEAAFVILDDVIWRGGAKSNYIGGLRPDQFSFLEAYLARAPKDRLLVLAMHIPLFDPVPGVETFRRADRERLFAMLQPFPKLLLLSAHTHQQMHVFHDASTGWHGATPLHEYNVGAACGAYWSGAEDAQGIPDSTMNDGTPNGYARLRVGKDGLPTLRYHVARAPREQQMTVHAPRVLRKGGYPAYGVYANVYMGHDRTPVEFRVDGGDWKPMRRVEIPDPALRTENARDDMADSLRGFDRSPEAVDSRHLWRGTLPTDLPAGSHRVEIRAQLEDGEARGEATYRLDEAASS
jgi:hypothetical protein